MAARPLVEVLAGLQTALDALDPGQVPARDAIDAVRVLDRISRVAEAAKATAAGRVAESSLWSRAGERSPAHWMAKLTGIGVGDAVKLLDLAAVAEDAPVVAEAFAAGTVFPRQARAAARAEKAAPGSGARLLAEAPKLTVTELERDADRVVAAASTETEQERARRHHGTRRFRHGIRGDGMGWGWWLLPPAAHARAIAKIEGEQRGVFDDARAGGVREPLEAYAADALCLVLDRAYRPDATPEGAAPGVGLPPAVAGSGSTPVDVHPGDRGCRGNVRPGANEDWSFAKVIVRVDLGALDRGALAPGEVCEIAGQGPVGTDDVWRMVDGGAFVAAVATRGTAIDKVVHFGRRPTVLQRTALEWMTAGTCVVEGCDSTARQEIDHVADWAETGRTTLPQLAAACGHHHDLKTHHGYRFGPVLPSGKRRLLTPDESPPAEQAPLFDSG